ncbi:MAG TPA: trehalose-phosphatase [Candidatus Gastranaerophilales bacterium]|nr:trehalose-phosphatase [Candidatus Gastranaerophilales bacterium]
MTSSNGWIHFWKCWVKPMILKEVLYPKIINGEKVLLMFDYDGTLTPIVDKPENAKLEPEIKNSLESLAEDSFMHIAIVSGRDIKTLKKLSGIKSKEISFFGIHGGQSIINGEICDYSSPLQKNRIQKMRAIFKKELQYFEGVMLENKIYSVAVHYRLADEGDIPEILKIIYEKLDDYNSDKELKIQSGKKVIEILPSNFSKDKAVRHLINACPEYFPVYFGDDYTDIPALTEAIKRKGVGIGIWSKDFTYPEGINVMKIEEINNFIKNISKEIKC